MGHESGPLGAGGERILERWSPSVEGGGYFAYSQTGKQNPRPQSLGAGFFLLLGGDLLITPGG